MPAFTGTKTLTRETPRRGVRDEEAGAAGAAGVAGVACVAGGTRSREGVAARGGDCWYSPAAAAAAAAPPPPPAAPAPSTATADESTAGCRDSSRAPAADFIY